MNLPDLPLRQETQPKSQNQLFESSDNPSVLAQSKISAATPGRVNLAVRRVEIK